MKKTGSTKEAIRQKALSLFAENGYEGTKMETIARTVGIKKASLYFHYRSKEAIFLDVIAMVEKEWLKLLTDMFADVDREQDVHKAVSTIICQYVNHMLEKTTWKFWTRLYIFPPPIFTPGKLKEIQSEDLLFFEKLTRFCEKKLFPLVSKKEISLFTRTIVRIIGGFIAVGDTTQRHEREKEIAEEIRLLLQGLYAAQKGEMK